MALEPSSIQRDQMLTYGKTKLTQVHFLVPKNERSGREFISDSLRVVQTQGGSRQHILQINQLLTVGEMPYQFLVVDSFPSSQALLLAHENSREIRQDSLDEVYSILVKPDIWTSRIVKWLGFLESTFSRWFDTAGIKEFDDFSDRLKPETDPNYEKVGEFRKGDLEKAFYMMNLNQFFSNGKASYKRYSIRVTPNLISVGGFPDIFGEVLGTYIGDQKSPLYNVWHEFGLVYYPSRTSFLRMMTNTPAIAAEARRAGLKKAVLMPCSQR